VLVGHEVPGGLDGANPPPQDVPSGTDATNAQSIALLTALVFNYSLGDLSQGELEQRYPNIDTASLSNLATLPDVCLPTGEGRKGSSNYSLHPRSDITIQVHLKKKAFWIAKFRLPDYSPDTRTFTWHKHGIAGAWRAALTYALVIAEDLD
jgi:hypothetical protein